MLSYGVLSQDSMSNTQTSMSAFLEAPRENVSLLSSEACWNFPYTLARGSLPFGRPVVVTESFSCQSNSHFSSFSFFHYVGHAQREPWSVLYFKVGQLGTLILSSNLALPFYCIRACIHRIHRMAVTWAFCRRKYLMPTKPEWLNLCKHSLPLFAAKFLTHSFAY